VHIRLTQAAPAEAAPLASAWLGRSAK